MKSPPSLRVLAVLPAEAVATEAYLAERTRLKVTTVRKLLAGLRAGGLARQVGATWQRVEQRNDKPAADAAMKE